MAIVSDKPQTTRHAIRGILTLPNAQIVFIDTPGFHKPHTLLGRRMNDVVRRTLKEVDAMVFVLDASGPVGTGDEFIAAELKGLSTPVVCVVNKADKVAPPKLLAQIETARRLGDWSEVLTTSAAKGTGLGDLVQSLIALLPQGPMLYPADTVTDQPEAQAVAELIREKALELVREEVPHSVAVVVEEISHRSDSDIVDVAAKLYVERESQKGILIGRGGRMLKEIGSRARKEIEPLLGSRIFLDLRVRVESRWPRDERLLERLGY